jgi:ABC-2 type transport system permease protein
MGAYAVANLQSSLEYRTAFFVQVIAMTANDSLWLFFWWTYFHQFPLVHGWQSTDVVILWSVSACGYGLSVVVFGNASKLSSLITRGSLDAYLGMPRYVLLHVSIASSDPTAWGDILFAVGAYVAFLHPDILHMGLFLLLTMFVCLIFTAFFILLGSLAFFLGNTEGLVQQMFGALISFSTYPMNIFQGAVRLLLFTVIPAGFISFLPLQLLHQFSWLLLGALVGFTVLFVGIATTVFHLGLRRYESGNLMGMQG